MVRKLMTVDSLCLGKFKKCYKDKHIGKSFIIQTFISCVFIEWNKLWSGVQRLKERKGKIANKNYTISITYWHMYSSAINRLILKPNRHSFCLQKEGCVSLIKIVSETFRWKSEWGLFNTGSLSSKKVNVYS